MTEIRQQAVGTVDANLQGYTGLIDLARHTKQSFSRHVSTAVYHVDEGVLVVATLQDLWHDMRMAILVNPETHEIADVRAVMLRFPFDTCMIAQQSYRRLIGLKLFAPGTMKKIHEVIPRADGCTHLYHVLDSCMRSLFIGGGRKEGAGKSEEEAAAWEKMTEEQRRAHNMKNPALKGSCISFSLPPREET